MTAPNNLPAERKPQIVAGAPVAALVPQTLDEAFRLSGALAASGMAPRGMDRPEQIMVAIMAGAELGLAPFQSLQSFAVVNGRPTLWGDGLMAVVRGQGVRVKEWIEGDGDNLVAHCLATRPDTGEEITRSFSVADAKKAGLWGKQGPWQQYPKRMLQMRARALSLRDGCADMLRGIQVREEVEDFQHVREVAPRATGLRERLSGPATDEGFTAAQAERADPVHFAEQAEEVEAAVEEIEAHASELEPATVEDDDGGFPGDEPAAAWDPLAWAADENARLETFATPAELDAHVADPVNGERFAKLQEANPGMASALNAAIKGRRKALISREVG